jgi:hypothetical protein
MSHDNGKLEFYAVCGFGLGLYWFYKGFRTYREYRVVEDTPEIPIRSIPMGLVRVHGRATGQNSLLSPLTRKPCFYYRVEIQEWKSDGQRGHSWHHYRTDTDSVFFYLEDGTGRVRVDPGLAEFDLPKSGEREVRGSGGPGPTALAPSAPTGEPSDQELLAYIGSAGSIPFAGFFQKMLSKAHSSDDPRKEQMRQLLAEALKHPVHSPLFAEQILKLGDLSQSLQGASQEHEAERAFVRQHFDLVAQQLAKGSQLASGRFRLVEYCLQAGQEYDITGTCIENPHPQDEHDRNLITKGQNEPTFLICGGKQQQVDASLRKRAAWQVFGGAGLAVACLGFLLVRFGLF